MIVVMKDGIVQQIGQPQEVYDDPVNLFVAKFLGTPPINVFEGEVKSDKLYIGEDCILNIKNVPDRKVYVGIRPEGFILNDNGALSCALSGLEVMGRDISVVSSNKNCLSTTIRSIISAENKVDLASSAVKFDVKPNKVFIFNHETEERIRFDA